MIFTAEDSVWKKYGYLLRSYMVGERSTVAVGIFFGALAGLLAGFGLPLMLESVLPVVFRGDPLPGPIQAWLDAHTTPEKAPEFTMWAAAILLPLLMMARGTATFLNSYLLTKAGLRILEKLRVALFSRLQELPLAFHERHKRGELINHVIGNTGTLQGNLIAILNDLIIQPLTLLAALSYLIYKAVENEEAAMLLVNLGITALCIPLIKKAATKMVRKTRQIVDTYADLTSIVEENLNAQREIRAFNLEEMQTATLRGRIRELISHSIKFAAWAQSVGPLIEIITATALAWSLYMGCRDGLTLSQFSAIAMAFYWCYAPVKTLGGLQNLVRTTGVIFDMVMDVMNAKDETPEPAEPAPLPAPKGDVSFRNVSFEYVPGSPVLKNIDINVPAGQIVALVGPSGSGKTTFINLICRFYDVQQGSVLIDGVDVRSLSREDRTRAVGLVSQFPVLFRESIRENIRLGRPDADDEAVLRAARAAYVHEFAEQTPEGYDRFLAEGGEGLSGGQRQRISIARAFLKNAPILILDEATASLDMKSEAAIQQSLERLAHGHTTFIIAHRFSTIRMATRILVFDDGRIVGDGTHAELYATSPLYRELYDRQAAQPSNDKEVQP